VRTIGVVMAMRAEAAPLLDALGAMDASGARVKDMEAAVVADVARLHGVPVLVFKAITDLVDEQVPTAEQLFVDFALTTARLRDAMLGVVDWCAERRIAELGDAELANTELGDAKQ
jgi:hypothetical protein